MSRHNHHSIREAIRQRITAGEWTPGTVIPNEATLADEYGCARTTVNRALQTLANDGLIERKRRVGTRVKELPVRRAKFEIPILRHEIEASGARYRAHIVLKDTVEAPDFVMARLRLKKRARVLHVQTLHLGDDRALAYEDRWVNLTAAQGIEKASFENISINEWLVRQIPYSSGDVAFSANPAGEREAELLETNVGAALFTVDRTTWLKDNVITSMKLYYRPGYSLHTKL